jgi:hypothetical protein
MIKVKVILCRICMTVLLITAASVGQQTASNPSATPVTEEQLLGTWVAVHRSLAGLGSMWTFQPGGKLEMSFGAIVDGWYKVEGDRLIYPPNSTLPGAKPQVFIFRVEGDTLVQRPVKEGATAEELETLRKAEMRMKRVVPARAGDPPIVGMWQVDPATAPSAASIAEAQRKAGHEIDERTAQAAADVARKTYHEYTRDGLAKIRIPMRTTRGTYDLATQTFTLQPEGAPSDSRHGGRFRIENGLLVLGQLEGKKEDTYIRATATKEELKRAGVQYGGTATHLDPP